MAFIKAQFDRYLLSYKAWGEEQNVMASLSCWTSSPWKQVGRIVFYRNEVPANTLYSNDLPSLHFNISEFSDVLGILRYEKPLFLRMNTEQPWHADLATSSEEIGEQEP